MRGRWLPILSVASPFITHCYTFCIIERFPFIIHNLSPPLSFSLFYLAFHRFVVTDLFLHLHGLILHPSIYYWQDQPDSSLSTHCQAHPSSQLPRRNAPTTTPSSPSKKSTFVHLLAVPLSFKTHNSLSNLPFLPIFSLSSILLPFLSHSLSFLISPKSSPNQERAGQLENRK